jgi:putative protein kinase ArgK-like GTPase of G3E family
MKTMRIGIAGPPGAGIYNAIRKLKNIFTQNYQENQLSLINLGSIF